ncbi:ribosomal protein L29 [Chloroherpeton thalassium ATCC 35110]|uniref:Large ribosomal subunit protein uL29 n=1 Tax=Chloroherpeton thalassium (strain ATCC 35110 / GB-78) TaxID=517418 RepID=RL29_CHLT3|nr:50S ribosomal protein L29 [Chloroherpeton thalassium]B3QYD2.1 RecName: Full=Large ribosomal subunit protein uL29; AltName: Full=50S ribosomal protein L29 [Chloroherpeton thalassium ATCC 35110]ACF13560.1 ribosomal protein L29 [Chloroherpeton thalassium ATCC 35110]
MKKHEIASLSEDELKKQLVELKQRFADIRFNKIVEPPQNPMIFKNLRRDIARMKTALHRYQTQK